MRAKLLEANDYRKLQNMSLTEIAEFLQKHDYQDEIKAVAVYGSVARGEADEDSDIDFLIITEDKKTREIVSQNFGSTRIEAGGGSRIGMTEAYSMEDYRNSLAHGSDFLENIQDELHIIYDPDEVLQNPQEVLESEQ